MEQHRVSGVNSSGAYDQTSKTRENERQRLDQLILAGPAAPVQAPPEQDLAADKLTADKVELTGRDSQAKPAHPVKPPEAGLPLPPLDGEVAFPVDGRGAAVALQEKLQSLREQPEAFADLAKNLGVQDIESFSRAVERGDALETFALVDPNNIFLVDAHRREIHADSVSSFAHAELVIQPRTASQETLRDPQEKMLERLENPILARINDPALQIQDRLANRPPQPQDTQQVS